MSNFLGQLVVEKMGHVASLSASFIISFIPIIVFSLLMPETRKTRGANTSSAEDSEMPHSLDYVLT